MATFVQFFQGIIAGLSLLGVGVALLYATSLSGSGINLVVNGTVVALSASRNIVPTNREPSIEITSEAAPADEASPEVVTPQVADEALLLSDLPPLSKSAAVDYYNLIAPDLSALMVSFGRLARMLENPRPEEMGWRSDVSQLIDLLEGAYARMTKLEVPTNATAMHLYLMEATGRCLGVTDTLGDELETVPPDLFPVLGKTLSRCTESMKSVANEIN